jgi:hypothetical protein
MEKLKPVVKWVIGPCDKVGFDVLNFSIKKFYNLYKDRFKYVICHNQITEKQIRFLPLNLIDEVVDQSLYEKSIVFPFPKNRLFGPAWKLYPPRLYHQCHELLIDNDLVIYRKLPEIEEFLNSKDLFIITEAYERNYKGKFENKVRENFIINSGFVGIPPNFDYASHINEVLLSVTDESGFEWSSHFEEQSVVASIFQNQNTKIIPLEKIQVNSKFIGNKIGFYGTHFTGTNEGFSEIWDKFKPTFFI